MSINNSKSKVVFLFGAGAERDFGLPSGAKFFEETMLSGNKTVVDVLEKYLKDKKYNSHSKYKYTKHYLWKDNVDKIFKSCIYAICVDNRDLFIKYQSLCKSAFSNYTYNELQETHEIYMECSDNCLKYDDAKRKFKNCVENLSIKCDQKIDGIFSQIFEYDGENILRLKINAIDCGEVLDQYFHTVADPDKNGKNNFSKILNYYWMAFFSVVKPLVKALEEIIPELKNYADIESLFSGYTRIVELIWNCELEKFRNLNTDSYYNILFEHKDEFNLEGILTTNYTPLVKILECEDDKIAYLNGRLDQMEIPGQLEILDVCSQKSLPENIFFPFIMGQSYVKPIIHPLQMKEYARANSIIKFSNIMVILGYGINKDDNHVNSYIHEFLRKEESEEDKLLIVVSSCDNRDKIATNLSIDKSQIKIIDRKNKENQVVISEILEIINEH